MHDEKKKQMWMLAYTSVSFLRNIRRLWRLFLMSEAHQEQSMDCYIYRLICEYNSSYGYTDGSIFILKICTCKHFISLKIFVDRLLYDLFRKKPVFRLLLVLVRLQPVTCELLIEGWLTMARLICICRPET